MLESTAEDLSRVSHSIVIRVFENQYPILAFVLPFLVGVGFRDPKPPPVIEFDIDGLPHIWFTGEQGCLESFGKFPALRNFIRRRRRVARGLSIPGSIRIR